MGSGSEKNKPAAPAYRFSENELVLRLHVQPGASSTGWGGRHGEQALKLRVAAPPVDGRANQECLRFLARAAGVPKGAVTLLRGGRSRDKTVRIAPLDEERFQALKMQWSS